MSNERAFRGVWIPAEIWLNRELSLQEKVMLIEIDSLQHPQKGCFKSNKKLAEFFGLSPNRVSEVISSLKKKGWVRVDQIREGKQIVERRIFMEHQLDKGAVGTRKVEGGYSENRENPIRKVEGGYSENREERGSGLGVHGEGKTTVHRDAMHDAFEIFWKAGMVKVSKAKAKAKFERLVRDGKEDPETFARLLARDVKARLAAHVFGFDLLHPTTYLNGKRWTDEIISQDLPPNVHRFHDRRPAPSSDDCGGKVYIPGPANGGAS